MSHWKYQRLFEILPGATAWLIIFLPFFLSWLSPKYFAITMIFYGSYWLVKTIFMSWRMIIGYRNYHLNMKTDWRKKLDELPEEKNWQRIYHLIIVPTYKEDIEILRSSIRSVSDSDFPMEKVIYVLATEERDKENASKVAATIRNEFGEKVGYFTTIMHPKDLPNEIIGKGGNITYAAKKILSYIKEQKILPENVIVTTLDADHIVNKNYLADLTYKYVTDPDPIHKSFQPLPMFFNNIWDVPMFTRLIAMGSSFWQLIVTTRPSRLRNFSAHAQSLAALIKTDFWATNTIVEDGHQYWRTYYRFNGRHEVVPMFTPIYQDCVLADNFWDTAHEQYLQKRRWAWGVSDIPYVFYHTFHDKTIPWVDRWSNALILWDSHVAWSTTSIVLATSSWMPMLMAGRFKMDILSFSFYAVYVKLLTVAWIGMIVTLILSTLIVPPRKGKKPTGRIILDWILTPLVLPISNVLFSAIPAIESQTRLMIGKPLGAFNVTKKSIKRSNILEGSNVEAIK